MPPLPAGLTRCTSDTAGRHDLERYSGRTMVATVISLFNHKGGVSKTTTAFNLGWMIARQGKNVLLVDSDPQCNLTGMVLGLEDMENADSIQGTKDGRPLNIREGLAPAFESRPALIQAVECPQVPGNDRLWLMPGHIGLAEYEVTLGIAQELSGSLVTLRNLPGSLRYLIDKTAEAYGIDIVIVDMSPSLGAVNQNLLATSNLFVVPMHPDYFSTMAVKSLTGVLPKWKAWADAAAHIDTLREAEYPFPATNPKFLGYVVQKYRPRGGYPSKAFQEWIDQLEASITETFIPTLKACGLMLDDGVYAAAGYDPNQPILQMPDFNSLIARSQEHQVPIFELTPQQLEQAGSVLASTQASQAQFRELFSTAAERVIRAVDASGA
jgi:cellulose biosynthesis protein BcsQ